MTLLFLWRCFSSAAAANPGVRWNPIGIQMLPKSLYEQVFGQKKGKSISEEAIQRSINHLLQHDLWDRPTQELTNIDLMLPQLIGNDVNAHFTELANTQLQAYQPLITHLTNGDLPPIPSSWSYHPGWTRYDESGHYSSVPFPDESALVLDVEVCVREGHAPTLAVAASPHYWYSWVSQRLVTEQDYLQRSKVTLEDLIPLADVGQQEQTERLIVGHNVSYDRARIMEQYMINSLKTKFLDTLSLHVCVAGQTTAQKILWQSTFGRKSNVEGRLANEEEYDEWAVRGQHTPSKWMGFSSPNSLSCVYQLHCGGQELDKSARDMFLTGSIADIRDNFQLLMSYCCQDVYCTHQVLKKVYPMFQRHCPHPVTLAGMLEMNLMYLPVNESWEEFIQSSRYTAEDMEHEMSTKLVSLANEACAYTKGDRYRKDVWLSNLDWSSKKLRSKRRTKKEMRLLMESIRNERKEERQDDLLISRPIPLTTRRVHKPGYPEWYRQLCTKITQSPWQPGPALITPNMRVVPYLLRIKWEGHPLYYHPSLAWGYIIPSYLKRGQRSVWSTDELRSHSSDDTFDLDELMYIPDDPYLKDEEEEFISLTTPPDSEDYPKDVIINFGCGQLGEEPHKQHQVETEFGVTDDIVTLGGDQYYYFKLPHKSGPRANCGNPLSKDFLSKMQTGLLTSSVGPVGQRILQLNSMGSFWRSIQKRIENQFVVWNDIDGEQSQGIILPVTMVAGTVTRRAVEATWLTASNAKENRIGSEMKAMIQCPAGYCLVGADVDSQELWIASLLGDQYFSNIQGGTAFSWMTLQGSKTDGTDVHSKTAQAIGISRDQAKVLTYGRIYGAGLGLSNMLLKQFNPSLTESEVEGKSLSLHKTTKGERRLLLTKKGQERAQEVGLSIHKDGSVTQSDWYNKFKSHQTRNNVISHRYWYGGTESSMFNRLEEIATSDEPRTPVLNCLISQALQKKNVGKKFMTSRINWVVQSSAVDYLHLLLVATRWLIDFYGISGRLSISIHDEVRYLVREEDKYKMAFALQVANLWTRAMFAHRLGMDDLPLSVAFFSAVDIDKVLRKEVTMDCKTPSNPLGLQKTYGIEFGEAINIEQTIEKLKETNFVYKKQKE